MTAGPPGAASRMTAPSVLDDRFPVLCPHCGQAVRARRDWTGRDVQCAHCGGVLRVPEAPPDGRPVEGLRPLAARRERFNFACPRCDSLLESHTGMSGQSGRCPTCNVRLIIPFLDRSHGRVDAAPVLDTDAQDPTPLHAYAASGARAPRIQRLPDGACEIECPRCAARAEITANACGRCGLPFTLEGMATGGPPAGATAGTGALVLGILALPASVLFVPGLCAVALGLLALFQWRRPGVHVRALIGLGLGLLSLPLGWLLLR